MSGLDGFNLTEERPDAAELVMPPMLEKASGFGRDLPLIRIRQAAPLVYVVAEFVDDGRGRFVLLLLGREPLAFVENQVLLIILSLAFPWLRNGRDELRAAPGFDDLLRWLALVIKLPVALRVLIG